jgi:hypothetical protein
MYLEREVVADDMASITAIRHYSGLKQNQPRAKRKPPPRPTPRVGSDHHRRPTLPAHGHPPPDGQSLHLQSRRPSITTKDGTEAEDSKDSLFPP